MFVRRKSDILSTDYGFTANTVTQGLGKSFRPHSEVARCSVAQWMPDYYMPSVRSQSKRNLIFLLIHILIAPSI